MAFLVGLAICLGSLFYQGSRLSILKKDKINLDKELSVFNPQLSVEQVQKAVNELKMQRSFAHQYAQKYLSLVAIREICVHTSQSVRLINFRLKDGNAAQLSAPSTAANASPNTATKSDAGTLQQEAADNVTIEGMIMGNRDMLESDLTKYVVSLENSPIFSKVSVKRKDIVTFKKKEVIHFVLGAKIG